jgi:hypothetical protein
MEGGDRGLFKVAVVLYRKIAVNLRQAVPGPRSEPEFSGIGSTSTEIQPRRSIFCSARTPVPPHTTTVGTVRVRVVRVVGLHF